LRDGILHPSIAYSDLNEQTVILLPKVVVFIVIVKNQMLLRIL